MHVLEIGCGQGALACALAYRRLKVTALDISETALESARANAGTLPITFLKADVARPLPFEAAQFGCVVAVLSLHYFSRSVTQDIFAEIRRVLAPGGLVCVYLNSEAEGQRRAAQGQVQRTLEPGVVLEQDGVTRRYFTKGDVQELLRGWTTLTREPAQITSLKGKTKACWRVLARR